MNCSWVLKAGWVVVKGFLDKKTKNKVKILGDKYLPELLKRIEIEDIPEFLGGKCKCEPKGCLMQPAGPWKEYYEKFPKDTDADDFTMPEPPPKYLANKIDGVNEIKKIEDPKLPEAKSELKCEDSKKLEITQNGHKKEENTDIKAEIKPEIKSEVKTEIKPEIQPEIKAEIKQEIQPEIKPEIKELPQIINHEEQKTEIQKIENPKLEEKPKEENKINENKSLSENKIEDKKISENVNQASNIESVSHEIKKEEQAKN